MQIKYIKGDATNPKGSRTKVIVHICNDVGGWGNADIHMPRIGCGLAGGQWADIEKIIKDNLIAHEIETTVYDFE